MYIEHVRLPLSSMVDDEDGELKEDQPFLFASSDRGSETEGDEPSARSSDSGGDDMQSNMSSKSSSVASSSSSYYKSFNNGDNKLDSEDFEEDEHPVASDKKLRGVPDPVPSWEKHRRNIDYNLRDRRPGDSRNSLCKRPLRRKGLPTRLIPELWRGNARLSLCVPEVFQTYEFNCEICLASWLAFRIGYGNYIEELGKHEGGSFAPL
jgi:hypothetical protein